MIMYFNGSKHPYFVSFLYRLAALCFLTSFLMFCEVLVEGHGQNSIYLYGVVQTWITPLCSFLISFPTTPCHHSPPLVGMFTCLTWTIICINLFFLSYFLFLNIFQVKTMLIESKMLRWIYLAYLFLVLGN